MSTLRTVLTSQGDSQSLIPQLQPTIFQVTRLVRQVFIENAYMQNLHATREVPQFLNMTACLWLWVQHHLAFRPCRLPVSASSYQLPISTQLFHVPLWIGLSQKGIARTPLQGCGQSNLNTPQTTGTPP